MKHGYTFFVPKKLSFIFLFCDQFQNRISDAGVSSEQSIIKNQVHGVGIICHREMGIYSDFKTDKVNQLVSFKICI